MIRYLCVVMLLLVFTTFVEACGSKGGGGSSGGSSHSHEYRRRKSNVPNWEPENSQGPCSFDPPNGPGRHGRVIATLDDVDDPEDCCDACVAYNCAAWNYWIAKRKCFLKNVVVALNEDEKPGGPTGWASGTRNAPY